MGETGTKSQHGLTTGARTLSFPTVVPPVLSFTSLRVRRLAGIMADCRRHDEIGAEAP